MSPRIAPKAFLDADGEWWVPAPAGKRRPWGSRWLRAATGEPFAWYRPLAVVGSEAASAARRTGAFALPLRPETQQAPPGGYPRPVFADGFPWAVGTAGYQPSLRDLAARAVKAAGGGDAKPRAVTHPEAVRLGAELRKRREALGLSQRDLAEVASTHRGTIDRLETGRVRRSAMWRTLHAELDAVERERRKGGAA